MLIEVGLQGMVIFDAFGFHKGLNLRVPGPLVPFILVTADVHVLIREKLRHLGEKAFEEGVQLFTRRVEGRVEDARPALDCVRPRRAAKLRMPDQPACR